MVALPDLTFRTGAFMPKRWMLLLLTVVLAPIAACKQDIQVTALSPNASSSTPYSCSYFEEYWNSDGWSQPDGERVELLYRFRLNDTDTERVSALLRDASYTELVGGYFPTYKFRFEGDLYCVSPYGLVVKNDSLHTSMPGLIELMDARYHDFWLSQ